MEEKILTDPSVAKLIKQAIQDANQFAYDDLNQFGESSNNNNNINLSENHISDEEEQEIEEYLPESKTLIEAKTKSQTQEEIDFITELLTYLDSQLPPPEQNIIDFQNDYPMHNNTISSNPFKHTPAKFPLERLAIEVTEEKDRQLQAKESRQIAKAKKPKKRNARDAPPKEIYMSEVPNKSTYEERYRGKPHIESLTERVVKRTFKETLPNSNVYPVLIREALILPNSFPSEVKEKVIQSYKDQINGNLELSIRRLEKAKMMYHDLSKTDELQCELFFTLNFGALYESLGLYTQALKYYHQAKLVSDKLMHVDPDTALVYCYFGAVFLKLSEFEWAVRCFIKAKEIREATIGGDTLDTAAVYNNLGVISFYMESFYPAKCYFNLAYEITRQILGLRHARTLMIKNNITKLSQLSFNKEVEFKTLSKYETPAQMVKNPKRKKK